MNEKITDYMVVDDYSLYKACHRVKIAIKDGWQPIGGMVVTVSPGSIEHFYQTLVKTTHG